MQRIDNPPNDLFINGDPTTGTVGTRVMAEWLNALQEEICCVVEESGLTLDAEDDTQLLAALNRTFGIATLNRSKFAWKDADEIYIGAFGYYHIGTQEQIVYSNAQLTYQFANLAASDWSYLYLDDSAIVTAGTNVITASELIDSTTEPTWSDAKHGWYNGNDKLIFAVRTNASGNILEFFHDGDLVLYGTEIIDLNFVDIDDVWTDVTLTIPKFCNKSLVTFTTNNPATTAWMYYRVNGSSSNGIELVIDDNTAARSYNTLPVLTDSSQKIEIKHNVSGSAEALVATCGWYFPTGM